MAVYAINAEGADSMRQLEQDMRRLCGEIEECYQKLAIQVQAEEENLGIYGEELLDLLEDIKKTQKKGNDALEDLARSVHTMTEKIESLIKSGILK